MCLGLTSGLGAGSFWSLSLSNLYSGGSVSSLSPTRTPFFSLNLPSYETERKHERRYLVGTSAWFFTITSCFVFCFPNPYISYIRKTDFLPCNKAEINADEPKTFLCERFLCEFVCVPYRDHVLRSDFGELRSWCVCCQRVTESTESVQRHRAALRGKTWEEVHRLLSFSWIQFKQESKNIVQMKSILTVLGFAGATSTELGQTVFCRNTGTHRGTCWLIHIYNVTYRRNTV